MKIMGKRGMLLLLSAILLTGCAGAAQQAEKENTSEETTDLVQGEVTILAAASMTDAMNALIEKYQEVSPGVKVNASYASSGALQAQIEEGAPADLFLSASNKQMNALEEKNLIDKDSRVQLFKNEVVLIKPVDGKARVTSFEDAAGDQVDKIAIADPDSVPVGQYSQEIFTTLGNWEEVEKKMVKSRDVRNTLDWVVQGEVDLGTVYQTDAMIEKDRVQIVAVAPEGSHKPVEYPLAIIGESGKNPGVQDFYQFLQSEPAQKIVEEFGFIPIP